MIKLDWTYLIKTHIKDQKCLLIKDDAVTPQELVKTSNQEIVLIVLDGTWREAKKMYSWSPPLQKLPKMKLDVDLKSQYVVKTQPNDKVGDIPSSFKIWPLLAAWHARLQGSSGSKKL